MKQCKEKYVCVKIHDDYNETEVMNVLCHIYRTWKKDNDDSIKRGCGRKGCIGNLTTDTEVLFNQLMWSLK